MLYSRSLLVIHFKYSGVYMLIPNPLTIPSPHSYPLVTSEFLLCLQDSSPSFQLQKSPQAFFTSIPPSCSQGYCTYPHHSMFHSNDLKCLSPSWMVSNSKTGTRLYSFCGSSEPPMIPGPNRYLINVC